MQIADLERSNLFESHWSNQWLTQDRVISSPPLRETRTAAESVGDSTPPMLHSTCQRDPVVTAPMYN